MSGSRCFRRIAVLRIRATELDAAFVKRGQILEQRHDVGDAVARSVAGVLDGDLGPTCGQLDAEPVLDEPEGFFVVSGDRLDYPGIQGDGSHGSGASPWDDAVIGPPVFLGDG